MHCRKTNKKTCQQQTYFTPESVEIKKFLALTPDQQRSPGTSWTLPCRQGQAAGWRQRKFCFQEQKSPQIRVYLGGSTIHLGLLEQGSDEASDPQPINILTKSNVNANYINLNLTLPMIFWKKIGTFTSLKAGVRDGTTDKTECQLADSSVIKSRTLTRPWNILQNALHSCMSSWLNAENKLRYIKLNLTWREIMVKHHSRYLKKDRLSTDPHWLPRLQETVCL